MGRSYPCSGQTAEHPHQRIDALPHQPFDARIFEYYFPTVSPAKLAIADNLAIPLARMPDVRLTTLINALFYDLAQDKQVQIPKQGERRERELVKIGKRPGHCLLMKPIT